MLSVLNSFIDKGNKYICVSRPRRFGKTMAGNMNTLDPFATKDDLFTYLIHLGYLAYDRENKTCRIPNKEIMEEWFNVVSVDDNYSVTDEIIRGSKELQSAIYLAYIYALNKYTIIREMTTDKGFADILFVGINYDEKTKTHSCRIERFDKG